jgi:hypothetical protein
VAGGVKNARVVCDVSVGQSKLPSFCGNVGYRFVMDSYNLLPDSERL